MNNISILGCGWLGKPLAVSLLEEGFSVKGSTTSEIKIQELEALEIEAYLVDITEFEEFDSFLQSDILIIAITSKDIDAFERLIEQIQTSTIQKVIFISSTSVYPVSNAIVSEETQTLKTPLAEIENQRRRFEKETKEAFEYGGFNFAKETLAVLDNLQRAYQSIKNDETLKDNKDLNKFLENIEIIEKDLVSIFEKNNIKKIKCLNEKFDPNQHQAMLEIEDEKVEPGTILQEIQPGYFLKDRLLRPSFVAIAKKKIIETDKNKEKN